MYNSANFYQELYDKICRREISIQKAADMVKKTPYQLKMLFHNLGYQEINGNPGRPKNVLSEDVIEAVQSYRENFRVGYKRCCDALSRHGEEYKQNQIRQVFQKEKLFLRERKQKESEHKLNFYSKYKDMQWNTDLHEIKINLSGQVYKMYLIAFIDDATRYILYAEIMNNKKSERAAQALENALNYSHIKPYSIHGDNGGEFTGAKFQEVMDTNGIVWSHSLPHTPQQNGKIERWWETLDGSLVSKDRIFSVIDEYNNYWPHSGLFKRFGKKTTPAEAREQLESWIGKDDLTHIYY